jgi:glycosyltransferase involved in cell wall biosynthesis
MQKPDIETYIVAWNEAETIHLTIKHYQAFSKVILYDNFSDDRTREIALEMGCEVRMFGRKGELNDAEYLKVKNRSWKGSKADFVIIVDADEILQEPKDFTGTIWKTKGFNIYSHDVPRENYSEIMTGHWDDNYSKTVIFSPKKLTDINFTYGAHKSDPKGEVVYSPEVLTLFHYRAIGGPERMVKRHAQYRKRMGYLNRTLGLGSHYLYDDNRRRKEWNEYYQKSFEYLPAGS